MSPASALLSSVEDWEALYSIVSAYGAHIALCAFLSAVTLYRREISCNRSYHDNDGFEIVIGSSTADQGNEISPSPPSTLSSLGRLPISEEHEIRAEQLLEGAGLYCSGEPIKNLASLWLQCFPNEGCGFTDGDEKEPSLRTLDGDLTAADLLERAGSYASGEPLIAAMALLLLLMKSKKAPIEASNFNSASSKNLCDPFRRDCPPDAHVQIASYLHPRDIISLSLVCKSYNNILEDPDNVTSSAIWKTLWLRDYGWIVLEWGIGREALRRSNCTQWDYSKEFYFRFRESYLDYVLAGMNTYEQCFVGIHSNIYDITPFLWAHPGSPDTLMVHSGRDATAFFEDMGHSMGARRTAMSLCVVVDKMTSSQYENGCGLVPTQHTRLVEDENRIPPRVTDGAENLLLGRRQARSSGAGTLLRIRKKYEAERERVRRTSTRKYARDRTVLGHEVNPYYDPFTREWRIWYTDTDLRTVYLPA